MKEKRICVYVNNNLIINYPDNVIDYKFYYELNKFQAEVLEDGYRKIITVDLDLTSVSQFLFQIKEMEQ